MPSVSGYGSEESAIPNEPPFLEGTSSLDDQIAETAKGRLPQPGPSQRKLTKIAQQRLGLQDLSELHTKLETLESLAPRTRASSQEEREFNTPLSTLSYVIDSFIKIVQALGRKMNRRIYQAVSAVTTAFTNVLQKGEPKNPQKLAASLEAVVVALRQPQDEEELNLVAIGAIYEALRT